MTRPESDARLTDAKRRRDQLKEWIERIDAGLLRTRSAEGGAKSVATTAADRDLYAKELAELDEKIAVAEKVHLP